MGATAVMGHTRVSAFEATLHGEHKSGKCTVGTANVPMGTPPKVGTIPGSAAVLVTSVHAVHNLKVAE